MRIILCKAGQPARIDDVHNHLYHMQKLVGGYIETVTSPNGYVLVCNEEGRIKELSENPVMGYFQSIMFGWPEVIYGDYFICFRNKDDFTDVPDDDYTDMILSILNTERGIRYDR